MEKDWELNTRRVVAQRREQKGRRRGVSSAHLPIRMPIVKRKPVQPQGVPAALLSAYTERKAARAVFFLAATGEVFE